MINQPWKSRNWFTYTPIVVPKSTDDVYYPSTKKQTINLTDVQGWEIIPSNRQDRKRGPPAPDICRVTLASEIVVRLYSGTVATSQRAFEAKGSKGTIEIDQITDFLEAMQAAKLLS
tara:strand:- start:234 stop:584 length:351 start_codon:yes stop_codon:yes gene_type:complete